ncbi:MAG: PEP-CTERM system TPR-repeat protein PrsT [Colwellia sp.]|nr:PEP-CTERM system TPR-repeat protein PrsT [Colwellia sp.]
MRFFLFVIFFTCSVNAFAHEAIKHYENALNLSNEGKLNEAEIAVKNSLQNDINYLPARLLLGKILLEKGNLRSAEKEFEQAKRLHADSYAVTMSLVEVKLLLEKNKEALTLLKAQEHLKTNSQYYYLQGNAYKALSQFDLALTSYNKAIVMNANVAKYHTALADFWYRKENAHKAELSFKQALLIDDNNIPALLLSCEVYKNQGLYQQAQQALSSIFLQEKNNQKALFSQSSLFLAQKKLPEALAVTLRLRELSPTDPFAKLLHSSIIAQQGDTKQARRILSEVDQQISGLNDKNKDNKQVLLLSATVNFINQNSHSAKRLFIRYLDLYGEDASARRYLAIISVREQDLQKAQLHIEKALGKNSNDVELYILASEIYRQAEQLDKQLNLLIKAKKNFPRDAKIRDHFIASLLANNQPEQALEELNNTNEQSNLQNKTVLGFMLLQAGLLEQAHKVTQALLNDHPGKVEVLQLAGELSLKTNDNSKEAIYFFNQALALDENFSPALMAQAGIYLQQGKLSEVEELYKKLLTINPKDAVVLQLYADLAIKQDRLSLAIKLLEPLASKGNYQTGRALLSLYVATKKMDRAQVLLSGLEDEYPLDEALLLSKSRLQAQLGELAPAKKSLNVLFGLIYDDSQKLIILANAQLELGDVDAATKTIERIRFMEQEPVPPLLQARFYVANSQYDKALVIIEEALKPDAERKRDDRPWLSLKVSVLITQRNFKQATVIVEDLYQRYQEREYLQLLAQLYGQQDKVDLLLTLLSKWLVKMPADTWAVVQLSSLAMVKDNISLAINTLESYPDLKNSPALLNNLANYHLQQYLITHGKTVVEVNKNSPLDPALSISIEYAKQAYELAPLNAAINDTLGWLYVQTGQTEKGLGLLREASARDVKNGIIYYHLSYALAKSNRSQQASSTLNQGVELLPEHKLRDLINTLFKK